MGGPRPAQGAGVTSTISSADVAEVVRLYEQTGLPLPPPDARLVVFDRRIDEPLTFEDWGYLLPRQTNNGRVKVMFGTHVHLVDRSEIRSLDPIRDKASYVRVGNLYHVSYEEPSGLALVAAEASRGHVSTALAVLQNFQWPYNLDQVFQPAATREGTVVPHWREYAGKLAVLHWVNESFVPGSDRKAILDNLERETVRYPFASAEIPSGMIEALRATLNTPRAPAGSNEALIDGLLECSYPGQMTDGLFLQKPKSFEPIQRILNKGYEMVPTLLHHLDDHRLTRARFGFMPVCRPNYCDIHIEVPHIIPVSALCWGLLDQMRGDRQDYTSDPHKVVRAWAEKYRSGDENRDCLTALLNIGALADANLTLAQKRHPELIMKAYEMRLKGQGHASISTLLKAMPGAGFNMKTIEKAAAKGCASADPGNEWEAIYALKELHSRRFEPEVTKRYNAMNPRWAPGKAAASSFASESDRLEIWRALTRATRRASDDLRFALIKWVNADGLSRRNRPMAIRYFQSFSKDRSMANKAIQASDENFEPSQTLCVARMARLKAAEALGIPAPKGENPSPQTWAIFNHRVDRRTAAFLAKR